MEAIRAVRPRLDRWYVWALVFFAIAGTRAIALGQSMFAADGAYDRYINYVAAAAVNAGYLPYRDFTFLHPPGVILWLTPFAWLGQAFGDHVGFGAAKVFVLLLTSAAFTLLAWSVRRLGIWASIAVALVAIVHGQEAGVDVRPELEAFYNPAFIIGMVVLGVALQHSLRHPLAKADDPDPAATGLTTREVSALPRDDPAATTGLPRPGGRAKIAVRTAPLVIAGALFGIAGVTKIVVGGPIVVVLVFVGIAAGWRAVAKICAGGLVAAVAIAGPFVAQAPVLAFDMIVRTQFGRAIESGALRNHLGPLSALPAPVLTAGILGVALVLVTAVLWHAARRPGLGWGWAWVGVGVIELGTLLVTPAHYGDYNALLTAPMAIGCAYAVAWLTRGIPRERRRLLVPAVAAAGAVLIAAVGVRPIRPPYFHPKAPVYSLAALTSALQNDRCVLGLPGDILIYTDRLSRDLRAGCPFIVDATGIRLAGTLGVPTPEAARWQTSTGTKAVLAAGKAAGIVVTNRGKSGVNKAFFNSSAWQVEAHAGLPAPWVVFGPAARTDDEPLPAAPPPTRTLAPTEPRSAAQPVHVDRDDDGHERHHHDADEDRD